MTGRTNEFVASHDTVGFLAIPLTPERKARLDALKARTGIPEQEIVGDLIDRLPVEQLRSEQSGR